MASPGGDGKFGDPAGTPEDILPATLEFREEGKHVVHN